jgi:hypothetical protein
MSRIEIVLTIVLIAALISTIARIDSWLLQDLAKTPDNQLAHLTRIGWIGMILFTFPIGPIVYVRFGKIQ